MTKYTNATMTSTPAAIYLRMSTESQNYSNHHQRAAIAQYARENALEIVREYADDGKSGLDIRRRAGLSRLIRDVQAGGASFKVIIVYDVSRWGRFQDVDEAAYHEHTCRRAGIAVVYCAEAFQNDGSPLASLLKSMKRTMAAEYSRELSAKVFSAQCRFIAMGYKQGGHAGYGLRRISLTADGTPRRELRYGEAKGTLTDRVVFALGPAHEIVTVRRIYRLYIDERVSEPKIAKLLNAEGIASEFGRPWTNCMVKTVLTNVKYIGKLAFNRRSGKLSSQRERNDPSKWVINDGAIPQLLTKALFKKAQDERARRTKQQNPAQLLELLRDCHKRHGNVTAQIMESDPLMPNPRKYFAAFGSLLTAYQLADLPSNTRHVRVDSRRSLLNLRRELFDEVCAFVTQTSALVEIAKTPYTLIINSKITMRVDVARFVQPLRGLGNWRVPLGAGADFVLVARHDPTSGKLLDYFLLPGNEFGGRPIYIKAENLSQFDGMRHASVDTIKFSKVVYDLC